MNQLSLFAVPVPVDSRVDTFVVSFHERIAEGISNADCIPWIDDAETSIAAFVAVLLASGWTFNPIAKQYERGGWFVWLRSQGKCGSPIAQWNRLAAE
jgi:hypothetical protein